MGDGNNNISISISNVYNRLEELNKSITDNTNIFKKIFKYNKDKYHQECDAKGCNSSKDYTIIYNKYCKQHIHDRPKISNINFFNKNNYNSLNTTSTQLPTNMKHHDLSFSTGHD
jgi:hypothetical protein